MHRILPAYSCSRALRASRLSPKMSRLSNRSPSETLRAAWYDLLGSSSSMRGSSRGRFSLPIQVSSSLFLPFAMVKKLLCARLQDCELPQPAPRIGSSTPRWVELAWLVEDRRAPHRG